MPDTRYNSILLSKFINCLMWDGKKAVATRVVYDALDQIKKRMPDVDPMQVFTEAVNNVKPSLEVRSRRVGGANYQVPMQVKPKRAESLAIRWILAAIRAKAGRPTYLRLADELMAAFQRRGRGHEPSASRPSRWPRRTRRSATSRGDAAVIRLTTEDTENTEEARQREDSSVPAASRLDQNHERCSGFVEEVGGRGEPR